MKEILTKIAAELGLEYQSIVENVDFAYYNEKDDFFIFLYYTYEDLLRITGSSPQRIEFALNTLIAELKRTEELAKFNDRGINYNLTLILFIALNQDYPELIQEFNKVEENYINAKKYVLPYHDDTLRQLQTKLKDSDDIALKINTLAIDHSDAIHSNDEPWYNLLLNLFVKIPFLNYQPAGGSLTIANLADSIAENLTDEESLLFSIIQATDISSISNIESFARNNNILE